MRKALDFFKRVWQEFSEDEVLLYAASVAFFAALSLAPMVLLFVGITGLFGEGTQQRMVATVTDAVGPQAGEVVRSIAAGGESFESARLSTIVSIGIILFSASTVVAALQSGLNRMWGVKAAPDAGWFNWVRKRLLSIAMVLGICFLLLTSTVLTTVIAMVMPSEGWMWQLISNVVSFAVFVLLFAAMFQILPDVRIAWRDVWMGAVVTSLLFAVGKYVLSLYIAYAGFDNRYGAAGSLVALLVWAYYSTINLFVGAEITQVHARRAGRPIVPDKHAVRIDDVRGTPQPA